VSQMPGGVYVGNTIDGRYELRRDLGRGAGGVIFEAVHCFTGRRVALKVVAPDIPPAQLPELRARLAREARALAAVRHPGVVEILDGGVLEDGTPYIVMENLEGRTLEGLLTTRGKIPISDTIGLALQLCDALDAAHEAGVVHRDLKPGNVLIVRDRAIGERVKLVDFGIAQLRGPKEEKITGIGAIIGTAAYMAPEQLLAFGDIDLRADVYALGITMFECLTGNVPYLGTYPRVLLQACGEGPVARLPAEVDPLIAAVVERAMAKKRDERFASASEMSAALRSAAPTARAQTAMLGPPATPRSATPAVPVVASVAQRRRAPRAPYVTPIRITLPEGGIDGRTEDISVGGMLVICREPCKVDVRVTVRFALPIEGHIVACDAHLRWARSARPDEADGPRALGLEFIEPTPELQASIARYTQLMGERC
jgi:serine/threonine protein kinase